MIVILPRTKFQLEAEVKHMNAKYMRLSAHSIEESKQGGNLSVDLIVVDEKVSTRFPVFGLQSDSHGFKPFVIDADGRVDFGAAYPDEHRYGLTNLFSVEIQKDLLIRWWSDAYDEKFRIDWIRGIEELVGGS